MKICTITSHNVYNHGASLQAYALMKYLINCGHETVIINYRPDYLSKDYNFFSIDNPKWEKSIPARLFYITLKFPGRLIALKRKKAFDQFTEKYLILTDKEYKSNKELKNNPPIADAYICGSDQIWNSLHQNGKDPAFYLDFVPPGKRRASYAPSFATDYIDKELETFVYTQVKNLHLISVREKSGVELLKKLKIESAVSVLDPVFLLGKNCWEELGNEKIPGEYILIYDFENNHHIKKLAIDLAKETGLKIYTISTGKRNYGDKNFRFIGPLMFVSLIKNAKYVISNSYHAAVFSIIFRIPFAIFYRSESINTRMRDLLEELNLSDRIVQSSEQRSRDVFREPINFEYSEEIIQRWMNFSKKYINCALTMEAESFNLLE